MSDAAAPRTWSWRNVGAGLLPFADAGGAELPLGRLLRLSLFQVTVGMAAVLLIGTLNRVMIVELHMPAWLVAVMISLPLVFAPFRMIVGHRSDTHRSVLGWKRVPYIWFGTLAQFGGLAIMPFALIRFPATGTVRPGSGRRGRRSPFCSRARACTRCRRAAWRWPPTSLLSARGPRWWRCSAPCCSWVRSARRSASAFSCRLSPS